jgi:hypothetical protein
MVTALVILLTLSPPDRSLPPPVAASALRQAAAIWAPYGVVLVVSTSARAATETLDPQPQIVVDVARIRAPRHTRAGEPLAAIEFDRGAPTSAVRVFLPALVDLLSESERYGVGFERWPIAARSVFLARALGRVIAHEIGHYLLGPEHTTRLMRTSFAPRELVDPSPAAFRLAPADVERLQARDPLKSQEAKLR